MPPHNKPKIGLVLGSGSARGMSHIGVIQQLLSLGITPDIVCGTSAGALIGAAYVTGHLQNFSDWALQLKPSDIMHYMNIRFASSGGLSEGSRLINTFRQQYGDVTTEQLRTPYAAVATDMITGQEVWLKEGNLWDNVRASIALPGLISPVQLEHRWLVDGGLVNPVPVSLCRAMGADIIIAVNLNGDIVGRHFSEDSSQPTDSFAARGSGTASTNSAKTVAGQHNGQEDNLIDNLIDKLSNNLWEKTAPLLNEWFGSKDETPSLANVLASTINIMQDRITRSRLAGEPADILLTPHLSHIGLMEFNRAEEAIEEGRHCVERMLPQLNFVLKRRHSY